MFHHRFSKIQHLKWFYSKCVQQKQQQQKMVTEWRVLLFSNWKLQSRPKIDDEKNSTQHPPKHHSNENAGTTHEKQLHLWLFSLKLRINKRWQSEKCACNKSFNWFYSRAPRWFYANNGKQTAKYSTATLALIFAVAFHFVKARKKISGRKNHLSKKCCLLCVLY